MSNNSIIYFDCRSPVSPFDAEPFGVTKLSRAHFLADRWRLNVTCPDEIDDRVCRLSRVLDNGDGINVTDVHLAANQSAGRFVRSAVAIGT